MSDAALKARLTGAAILRYRLRQGVTREQLALLVGVRWQTVESWEAGRASPSRANLSRISQVLGVRKSTLGGED